MSGIFYFSLLHSGFYFKFDEDNNISIQFKSEVMLKLCLILHWLNKKSSSDERNKIGNIGKMLLTIIFKLYF